MECNCLSAILLINLYPPPLPTNLTELYRPNENNNFNFESMFKINTKVSWDLIDYYRKNEQQNVKIWNGNASREFLDSRNLHHYNENDLGPIYGYQWRHFNKPYENKEKHYRNKYLDDCLNVKNTDNIDQLQTIIDSLKDKEERYSRRLIMTAWNPLQLHQMALPPCHILSQFCVLDDKLSCILYQRSGDIGLGIPFNIASYSFLTILLAHHCGLKPGEFIHHIGDAHIYEEHIDALNVQITRTPLDEPTCDIMNIRANIDEYEIDDFKINNYSYHGKIDMEMKA